MYDNKISTPPTGHRLKPGAKIILLLVVGAVLFFGFRTAVSRGWIPAPGIAKALVPSKAALPDLKEAVVANVRSEEHTSELQSHLNLVCRLLLEKKKNHNASYK